jgi:hypothetical protein
MFTGTRTVKKILGCKEGKYEKEDPSKDGKTI